VPGSNVPVQGALAEEESTADVALELRRVVVHDVPVGRGVVADGAQGALNGCIELQQGAPAG